jgi:hypothetical protein
MVALLCARLPKVYWVATGHVLSPTAGRDPSYDLLTVLSVAIALWLTGAIMLRQRAVALGAPVLAGAELRAVLQRLAVILVSALLATLSVLAGLLLVIVPGVYLLVCYLVLLPVVLFEGLGPYAALVRSVRLIRPLWWKALAAFVIASLVFVIFGFIVAALIGVIAGMLPGGPALAAVETACTVGYGALFLVYLGALMLALHSAASSSA